MLNRRSDALTVEIIDPVAIEFVMEELLRSIAVGRLKDRRREIEHFVEKSLSIIEPKAVYALTRVVNTEGDEVLLESGHILKSVVLGDVLARGQRVAPYVATIGPKLEEEASKLGVTNVFGAFVLERVGDYAVNKAGLHVRRHVENKLGGAVSSFGPGTGSGKLFGIEQQEVLFSILNPTRNIGVRLTSNYLMVPRKSISGVFAVTSNEYVACRYCPRERCEGRRSAFAGEYVSIRCGRVD